VNWCMSRLAKGTDKEGKVELRWYPKSKEADCCELIAEIRHLKQLKMSASA
jgi:hypothetical protein